MIDWQSVTPLFNGVIEDTAIEIQHAIDKHGWEQTPLNPDMDRRDAYIIVSEEHGEVARALTYDGVNRSKLEDEIIQTIAMNVAMLIGIRSKHAE